MKKRRWIGLATLAVTLVVALGLAPRPALAEGAANYKGGSPYYKTIGDSANVVNNIEIYGNLLSYDDAVASTPEGWRLPTDEDWQKLEQALGMDAKTSG